MRDLSGATLEDLKLLVHEQDMVVESITGYRATEFINWYKAGAKATDEPLRLYKFGSLQLNPIHHTVKLTYPQPKGWPREIREKMVRLMMIDLEEKVREALFGEKAEKRMQAREDYLKLRANGFKKEAKRDDAATEAEVDEGGQGEARQLVAAE